MKSWKNNKNIDEDGSAVEIWVLTLSRVTLASDIRALGNVVAKSPLKISNRGPKSWAVI